MLINRAKAISLEKLTFSYLEIQNFQKARGLEPTIQINEKHQLAQASIIYSIPFSWKNAFDCSLNKKKKKNRNSVSQARQHKWNSSQCHTHRDLHQDMGFGGRRRTRDLKDIASAQREPMKWRGKHQHWAFGENPRQQLFSAFISIYPLSNPFFHPT